MNLADGIDLASERDRLSGKLDRLWNWLEANPDHEEAPRRTEVWLGTLMKYLHTCDELEKIRKEVLSS